MKFIKITGVILLSLITITIWYLKSQENSVDITNHVILSDSSRLKRDMMYILNTPHARNYNHIKELNYVADYIKNEFSQISDSVSEQQFVVEDSTYKNIICSINTDKKERIIIGAHYDVCDDQDGADDNASGVVGMLELARLLKSKKLPYRIDFVAYTLEEPPYYASKNMGSYIHAKYLKDNNINVLGMISLEMIGYYSDAELSQTYPIEFMKWIYGSKGDFITVVQKFNNGKFGSKFKNLILDQKLIRTIAFQAPSFLPGIDFSDHRSYWHFGYSAIMITNTAFYRNKNYHQHTDKIQTIHFKKLGLVVDEVYKTLLDYK
jgi:Zn-dependent M28 family amino/carboxypeptidase